MVDGLEFTKDGEIALLTFARPEKKNAITREMWSAIPDVVAEVEGDPELKVLVLTGAGTDFSAGADISEFGALRSTADGAAVYDETVEGAVIALAGMRKPSVAKIRGNCVGGGCQIAIACDFRFAEEGARFGIPPAKLGVIYPFVATRQLVTLVGPAHARYFLLSGLLIDSARAQRIGLLNDTFPAEMFEEQVMSFGRTLCSRSQVSVRGMKRVIDKIAAGQRDRDAEFDAISHEAMHGADYAEGVAAFLERRAPKFTYR